MHRKWVLKDELGLVSLQKFWVFSYTDRLGEILVIQMVKLTKAQLFQNVSVYGGSRGRSVGPQLKPFSRI